MQCAPKVVTEAETESLLMAVGRKSTAGHGTRDRSDQCAESMVLIVLPCSAVTEQVEEK